MKKCQFKVFQTLIFQWQEDVSCSDLHMDICLDTDQDRLWSCVSIIFYATELEVAADFTQ